MNDNTFFKPTPLYKEFVILDLIEKKEKITQRYMSDYLKVSVSMVNSYLDNYEDRGYISREYINSKIVTYTITNRGIERKKILNFGFLKSSQSIYYLARENINTFLNHIVKSGYKNIVLYGAGEVAEILLRTIKIDKESPLKVIAVIDDDVNKHGNLLLDEKIVSQDILNKIDYDGVLISSYTNQKTIELKLKDKKIGDTQILKFFN